MKIRTDFITNCSSYSTAEVVIDNPFLLKILQRYKELGAFGDGQYFFNFGSYNTEPTREGENTQIAPINTKSPAFAYKEKDTAPDSWPTSLEEVLNKILEILDWTKENDESDFDENLYEHLKEEIKLQQCEICENYIEVRWDYLRTMHGGLYRQAHYHYDETNGGSFQFEQKGENFTFDNW